jgi:hypothetical protein
MLYFVKHLNSLVPRLIFLHYIRGRGEGGLGMRLTSPLVVLILMNENSPSPCPRYLGPHSKSSSYATARHCMATIGPYYPELDQLIPPDSL